MRFTNTAYQHTTMEQPPQPRHLTLGSVIHTAGMAGKGPGDGDAEGRGLGTAKQTLAADGAAALRPAPASAARTHTLPG